MMIVAGKFMLGTKFELQSRVFLIPWVQKNFIRSCSKDSDHCSSFPVRYIPKKSSKTNQSRTSSPPTKNHKEKEVLECLEPNALRVESSNAEKSLRRGFDSDEQLQCGNIVGKSSKKGFSLDAFAKPQKGNRNKRPSTSIVFNATSGMENDIDHQWRLEKPEFMEEPGDAVKGLETHQEEDAHKKLAFGTVKTKQDAENMAIRLLATRAYTTAELKKKLLGKKYSSEIVNSVIADFESRGLINDFLYAETFSRSRWSSLSWGPRRIKQALSEKGVSKVDAEKAIKLVLEDGESDEDQVSALGLSNQSMDHLISHASKQWLRGQDVPTEKRKSRITMWLQYRGFNWGVINFVLKQLQSKYPP